LRHDHIEVQPSDHLTTDPLAAASGMAPFEALLLTAAETTGLLESYRDIRRTMRDVAQIGRALKPPACAAPPNPSCPATPVSGTRFKRVHLEFDTARGLRRHGRARHA